MRENLGWFFFICLIYCRLLRLIIITNKTRSAFEDQIPDICLTLSAASDWFVRVSVWSLLTTLTVWSCWVAVSWPATPPESISTISNCSFSSFFLNYKSQVKDGVLFNVGSCLTRLTWTTLFTLRMTFFVWLLSYVSISGSSLNETDFLTFLPWNVWMISHVRLVGVRGKYCCYVVC